MEEGFVRFALEVKLARVIIYVQRNGTTTCQDIASCGTWSRFGVGMDKLETGNLKLPSDRYGRLTFSG